MKKLMVLFLAAALLSCETPVENTSEELFDPQVAVTVMNDYKENADALKDPGKWVDNQDLLTAAFKKDYRKLMDEAWESDPELGLGFDPVFNAQDYPDNGFELKSADSQTGIVILQGVGDNGFTVRTKLVQLNGKCLVDGVGVIRM